MLPHSLKKFKYLEKIYDIILYGEDKETMDRFNDQDTAQEHSTNRISTYERYLNFISENVDSAVVVNPYVNNKRIQSQDSFFTLHVDPFKGLDMEETKKIIIPGELKKKIRQQLTLLGTHEYSIFPDEDGLCKWLKRKHYSEIMG